MGGYIKSTKDFYKKLWAWLEMASSQNDSPGDYRMMLEEHSRYTHFHFSVMLGFVRAWPEMPELNELKPLYDKAKELAAGDTPDFSRCLQTLRQLKSEMLKNGMGGK